MRRDTIFLVLYLMIIGALLVTQTPRYENRSVATKDTTPVASQNNEPVADKPDDAGPQTVGTVDKTAVRRNSFSQIDSKRERTRNRSSPT